MLNMECNWNKKGKQKFRAYNQEFYSDLSFIHIFFLKFSKIQINWLKIHFFVALNLVKISI